MDKHTGVYEMSQTFSGDTQQTIEFDVSSCFRAVADNYRYQPVTSLEDILFPVFRASVRAYASYIKDGSRITTPDLYPGGTNEGDNPNSGNSRFIIETRMGRYSDFERHLSVSSASLVATLTRKPLSSPELVFVGDIIRYAHYITTTGPSPSNVPVTSSYQITEDTKEHSSITLEGHKYFVAPRSRGSVQFQFVNSRGCIETIRAFALPSEKGKLSITDRTISRFESFDDFSRRISHKQQQPSELSLSSGPVDYQWAQWWFYEFCKSENVWMLVDEHNPFARNVNFSQIANDDTSMSVWIPVNIKPSDSVSIINYSKTEIISVEFDVIPDLNGPLF